MKRACAALLVALAIPATPGFATESLVCSAADNAASIDVLMGHTAVVAAVRVWLEAGDKSWTTDGQPGSTKISIGQAFEDGDHLLLDVTDDGLTTIIAKLRLYKAQEQADFASGGTLSIAGVGAWAVTCPEL